MLILQLNQSVESLVIVERSSMQQVMCGRSEITTKACTFPTVASSQRMMI